MENATSPVRGGDPSGRSPLAFVVLNAVYVVGVAGNATALAILLHRDKRRNRKHLLMLRCLTTNDLIAMLGTWAQMYVSRWSLAGSSHPLCFLHVLWRLFGLFSGCVALVMAGERWLALTRPFLYQKVTFPMIVRCLALLWLAALGLTFLPFAGFGLYQEAAAAGGTKCRRYRDASAAKDVAYAYLWCCCGTALCLSIVWCNLAVARALRRLGRLTVRRVSRASSSRRTQPLLQRAPAAHGPELCTPEERAFAKLMAMLSVSFLACWMPQMICIPLAQYLVRAPDAGAGARRLIEGFQRAADVLLCLHFTLDPYIYVLLRVPRPRLPLLKPLCRACWPARSRASSFTEDKTVAVGTTEQPGSSGGDPSTPMTDVPSSPASQRQASPFVVAVL